MEIPAIVLSTNDKPYKLESFSVKSDGLSNVIYISAVYRKMKLFEKKDGALKLKACREMIDTPKEGMCVWWGSPHYSDPFCKTIQVDFSIVPNRGRVLYD